MRHSAGFAPHRYEHNGATRQPPAFNGPQRRGAGGRDPGWCRRLAEVGEDGAHGGGVGDEGDDPHLAPTLRAQEREYCVDAGQQQRPGVAGGAAVGGSSAGSDGLEVVRCLLWVAARMLSLS